MRLVTAFLAILVVITEAAVLDRLQTVKLETLPPPVFTIPAGCQYNGKHYPVGSFKPSPCEYCQCEASGQAFCAIADCFITPCVDAVHDPTKCCPVCPNGHNCKAPDGHIIKKGETYKPDPNTECRCGQFSFNLRAECSIRITEPRPVTPSVSK